METEHPILEMNIDRIAFGGAGVGRLPSGKVCFVPHTAPGESVRLRLLQEKKNFAKGELLEVLTPSPERIPAVCPLADRCPGCAYQHLTESCEVAVKSAQLNDFFTRNAPAASNNCEFRPPLAPPPFYGYRNKITLHAQWQDQQIVLGYYMEDNRTVLDIPACPLATDSINARLAELRNTPDFLKHLQSGDTVTIREANNGVFHWVNGDHAGIPPLRFDTPCGELEAAPGSFFQINRAGLAVMQSEVSRLLESLPVIPETFLDLYCGTGFFSAAAAQAGIANIIGSDSDPNAVFNASENLRRLGHANAKFFTVPTSQIVARLLKKGGQSAILLVDPPRTGLESTTIQAINRSKITEMIYVSCGPDTLGRDLKGLADGGFTAVSTVMLNMFPRTPHLESITLLRRQ